jgi:hypothetical protein
MGALITQIFPNYLWPKSGSSVVKNAQVGGPPVFDLQLEIILEALIFFGKLHMIMAKIICGLEKRESLVLSH